jgi:hypothetical protein
VSALPLARHQFGRQATDAVELLALPEVRRRVQSCPAERRLAPGLSMKPAPTDGQAVLADTLAQLTDLIAALDRRVPQVERLGEAAIANAAVRLRLEAAKRIAEIQQELAAQRAR